MALFLVWLTTFGVCVVGAVIPFVNTEIYLLSASALTPSAFAVPLVTAAAAGQMLGKVGMYFAGRGLLQLPVRRMRSGLRSAQEYLERRPRMGKVLLVSSATLGLPPFYVMAVASGAVRMNLAFFIVAGLAGRTVRFTAVVLLPQLAKTWIG